MVLYPQDEGSTCTRCRATCPGIFFIFVNIDIQYMYKYIAVWMSNNYEELCLLMIADIFTKDLD